MNTGVEWAVHCCITLGWHGEGRVVSTAQLATWFDLPPEYLKKRLQDLTRAGLLTSSSGKAGGFSLAKDPSRITLLDVVEAVEGDEETFRCLEIRRQGRCGELNADDGRRACGVSVTFRKADRAWRRELASQTIADLMSAVPARVVANARAGLTAPGPS